MKYDEQYKLKLSLTNECNYNCDYCFLHYKDKTKLTLANMKKYIDIIYSTLIKDKYTKVKFCITGGEPTLVPYFEELMLFLVKKFENFDIDFRITTNLTKINKIKNILSNIDFKDNIKLRVQVSWHKSQEKKEFKVWYQDKIKELGFYIKNNNIKNIRIVIFFMLENNEASYNDYLEIINNFDLYNIDVTNSLKYNKKNKHILFLPIDGIPGYYNNGFLLKYTKHNFLNNFKQNENIEVADIKNNKNMMCNAVVNSSYIKSNGDYFPCPNCNINDCKIGNLNDIRTVTKLKAIKNIGAYLCTYEKCYDYYTIFNQESMKDFF